MSASLLTDKPDWQRPDRQWNCRRIACAACGWEEEGHPSEKPTFCPRCTSVLVTASFITVPEDPCPCCGRSTCR